MLSILKDIPGFVLSCDLGDFAIIADKSVTVEISQLGSILFSATFVPDAKSEIHLRDLSSIIEAYLTAEPMQLFKYSVSAVNEQTIIKSFTVLMCRFGESGDGQQFVDNHFLTNLLGRKDIGPGSTEYLYYTNGSTTSACTDAVNVLCTYVAADNKIVKENKTLSHAGSVGINKVDVSPSLFEKDDATLSRYVVTVGARSMRYDIHGRFTASTIRFKNNFGCLETFTFAGLVEVEPEFSRSSARINGKLVNYDIRKVDNYKCYSSYIPHEMLYFADDIAASDEVYFVVKGQLFPISVVESETPRNNSSASLHSFWIRFVPADRRGFRLPELTRIFDDTFDKTYN